MDFHALLNTADKNAKKVSKALNGLETEVSKEKKSNLQRLEAEKLAKLELLKKKRDALRRERTPEKKFTIPKKKNEETTVDRSKIQAFLAKQEEEKRRAEKARQAEKEKLIQLRLQTHGGKANKKIGKHFGINPIDMQIRYGNDHEHVEKLQKQKWREEEEQDRMADQYRDGVYKALAQKKKVEEKMKASDSGAPRQPHRVSTSKSNSLAGLSSRHASCRDNFSPPPESSKSKKPASSGTGIQKKRPPPPNLDFGTLMKAAEDISQGKKVDLNMDRPIKKSREEPSSSRNQYQSSSSSNISRQVSVERDKQRDHSSRKPDISREKPRPSNGIVMRPPSFSTPRPAHNGSSAQSKSSRDERPSYKNNEKDEDDGKPKKDAKRGRFVKGPTPPPLIPAAVPGKKYLPGDVRYKQSLEMAKTSGGAPSGSSSSRPSPPQSSSSSSFKNKGLDRDRQRDYPSTSSSSKLAKEPERGRDHRPQQQKVSDGDRRRMERDREIERLRRRKEERDMESIEKIRRQERLRAEQRMSLVERERIRERQRHREEYSDEEMDDDYDSELDDFIDDTEMDMDDLSRQEFEETLKMVNPKYNKKKWKERERTIDDRSMVSDYRRIDQEEKRSAKYGMYEDILEAKKHKSEAL